MFDLPSGGTALAEPLIGADEEFELDVRVVVAFAAPSRADCPTDDGCGNTCAGSASSCNSAPDDLS
ncbi:FxLD family lanthipeptide [Sphaerisporangium sp. NPDC051017]|uniref:FxLD family lanthipeptide n=1 Tax=unclassified Sphaerisporangium TaxID=2630420 RepID=UPI0033F71DCE